MKVKVGKRVSDSEKTPIMLVLDDEEKRGIANMLPEAHKIAFYDANEFEEKEIREWMQLPEAGGKTLVT